VSTPPIRVAADLIALMLLLGRTGEDTTYKRTCAHSTARKISTRADRLGLDGKSSTHERTPADAGVMYHPGSSSPHDCR
ncbi:hypothetical protein F5B20DRAFT_559551, partial [Whalleya microplaca]